MGAPEPLRIQVGRRLRDAREQQGLSQAALAERAGLSRSYLSGVELGARNATLDVLERLAMALGVAPERVLTAGPWDEVTARLGELLGRLQASDHVALLRVAERLATYEKAARSRRPRPAGEARDDS